MSDQTPSVAILAAGAAAAPVASAPAAAPGSRKLASGAECVPGPDGSAAIIFGETRLLVRPLDVLEEQDLIIALGERACLNRLAYARAKSAASVREINGEGCTTPSTDLELRAQMKRVGAEGLTHVMAFFMGDGAGDGEAEVKN